MALRVLEGRPLAAKSVDWPAPSFIDTLFGAMMHNEVIYGTQAF
jgi:hypothetical protein